VIERAVKDGWAGAYRAGASIRELARRDGVARATVRRALVEWGVGLRGRVELPSGPAWWRAQFRAGRNVAVLAAEFGVTEVTIWRTLRVLGMPRSAPEPFGRWLAGKTTEDGGCLRWTGTHNGDGYPISYRDRTEELATRAVWLRRYGQIPTGQEIVHTARCRFRDCVRLSHLRAVDTAAYRAELAALGRYPHGEEHWNAKLSEAAARHILHSARPAPDLASEFHVSRGTINGIRARRTWRHLS
jgi:hypothetical protein